MVNGTVTVCVFQMQDQHTGRRAVLPPISELVWSNGRMRDLVTDHLGVVDDGNGN